MPNLPGSSELQEFSISSHVSSTSFYLSLFTTPWSINNGKLDSDRFNKVLILSTGQLSFTTDILYSIHHFNPLHVKFFRGNKNIYLHFISILHIDKTQVIGILPHEKLTYFIQPLSWLLMTWRRIGFCILIKISLKVVPKGPINNIPALVQIMVWCRPGNKPLSETTRTTRTPAFWGYPCRLMITHTIDQFILLTSSYRIPSQNKMKAKKLEKLAKNWNFRILS